eukprot:GHUV01031798.1.p1 GENE.GHUV01031798.1~~GHUV01031798.1.p1  ORF type:complete len:185 (+),score=38.57 GHUV01031798.1:86-640(+)
MCSGTHAVAQLATRGWSQCLLHCISQQARAQAPPLPLHCRSDYSGQLEFDLGNLTAHDPSPVNPEDYTPLNRDATCLEVATAMTQALVTQLFNLPSEAVQGGRLAQLPAPTTVLPREKPIPKPKPLTKWQKFAQVHTVKAAQTAVIHPQQCAVVASVQPRGHIHCCHRKRYRVCMSPDPSVWLY